MDLGEGDKPLWYGSFFLTMEGMRAYVAFLHGEQLIAQMLWGLLLIGLTVFLIVGVARSKLTRERKVRSCSFWHSLR